MLPFMQRKHLQKRLAALDLCPLPAPLDLTKAKKVMVFAPHPDDETLGCGGTLARLVERCDVKVVLVTDGSGAGGLPDGAATTRQREFQRALARLGITDFECLQQPDGAFVGSKILEHQILKLMRAFQPNWVFMPSPLDYHRDHIRISSFVEPLSRRVASVECLLFFEIWAPIPASHVVDVTDYMETRQAALSEHVTALACGDYLRAAEGLARYRGLYLGINRMAEAFLVESLEQPSVFHKLQALGLDVLERMRSGR